MDKKISENPLFIGPIEGFSTNISHLIKMMNYARMTTIQSVLGLTREKLDYQFSENSNSIGALLAHMAAVETWYQYYSFEGREITEKELEPIKPAIELGNLGREKIKGNPVEFYVEELRRVRRITLAEFAKRDDEWLLKPIRTSQDEKVNNYFDWFHVMEDEINHRGQIRLIRKMQDQV